MRFASVCLASLALSGCTSTSSEQPGSNAQIKADQLAIYSAVLNSWAKDEPGRLFVDEKLTSPPSLQEAGNKACTSGARFPDKAAPQDGLENLQGVRFADPRIEVVDGSKWRLADPADGMANGKSVEAAVREGFSKALISLSVVAFSDDRADALVSFGSVCGSLCGSGATIHLHKASTGWAIAGRCGGWIS